jgi:hypothetical protein
VSKAGSASKFFTRFRDRLTGSSRSERFILKRAENALFTQIDVITGFDRNDVIDLPGSWGRGGAGQTFRKPLFTFRSGIDTAGGLVERNLKAGSAGIYSVLGESNSSFTVLFWNRGSRFFSPYEDVSIALLEYQGPVSVI